MFNTKRVVMDSVRLDKKLKELSDKGFKMRQQLLYCDIGNYLEDKDYEELRIENVKFPLSKIEMIFCCGESCVTVAIVADSPRKTKLLCYDGNVSGQLKSSGLEYALFSEDTIDDAVDLDEFELCLGTIILEERLRKFGLLVDNSILYSLFNSYEYRSKSKGYDVGKLVGLGRKYSTDIIKLLRDSGYKCNDGFTFMSNDLFSGVNLSYYGEYMDIVYFDKFGFDRDFSSEVSSEIAISDFADIELVKPKYQMLMLNGEINSAKFNFNDIDLDDVLEGLNKEGYSLDSIGVACVRSMLNSITVCGFKNDNGYLYVEFYYDFLEDSFLVNFVSSREKFGTVQVNNRDVYLVDVNLSILDSTTFIRGFDFCNFEMFSLV